MYILCGLEGDLIFPQQNGSNPQIIAAYDTTIKKKTARYSKGVYQMSEYRLKTPQRVEQEFVSVFLKKTDSRAQDRR